MYHMPPLHPTLPAMNKIPWYHIVIVVAVLALLAFFVYAVRGVLPPFIIAIAIAWLLDPVLDKLQRRGVPRMAAVAGVYVVFLTLFVLGIRFLVPAIIDQAAQIAKDFPHQYQRFSNLAADLMEKNHGLLAKLKLPTTIDEIATKYQPQVTGAATAAFGRIGGSLAANAGKVLWLVLIPLAAFYFLNDIDNIRRKSVLFIPRRSRERVVSVGSRMGQVFSNYVRGLFLVCLLYALTTTFFLSVVQLKYGIILGLVAGLLYAVPYVGAFATALMVFLVGLATYSGGIMHSVGVALGMVALNQVFDFFITPRILGKSVGLHPVLSMFALMAGGELFGLVGMILAVPLAASIQEVVYEFYPELKSPPRKKRMIRRRPKKAI